MANPTVLEDQDRDQEGGGPRGAPWGEVAGGIVRGGEVRATGVLGDRLGLNPRRWGHRKVIWTERLEGGTRIDKKACGKITGEWVVLLDPIPSLMFGDSAIHRTPLPPPRPQRACYPGKEAQPVQRGRPHGGGDGGQHRGFRGARPRRISRRSCPQAQGVHDDSARGG